MCGRRWAPAQSNADLPAAYGLGMTESVDGLEIGLLGLRHAAAERALRLEGIHVIRKARPPASFRWSPDERRDVWSVSKTFTSVAVGIAQGDGLLRLDDPVLTHLPQFAESAAPGVDQVTIRHLLCMTSGIDYRWPDPDADHVGDPARDFLATSPVAAPGTWHAYRGTSSYVLSRIIAAASGSDLRDYLMPRLFEPLGIRNPQWHRCPLGFSLGAAGLFLRTEEIARLWLTLLDAGKYDGRQLIPEAYVALMHQTATPTNRTLAGPAGLPDLDNAVYGLHCWHCSRDDAWRMDGLYGQFCIMFPHQQACIAVTANYDKAPGDILDAIWTEVVPYL